MSNTKTVLGFVAGAAIGAIAGILLAPEKGSETRNIIKGKAGDISDSIKKAFTDFVDDVKTTYTSTKEEADELSQKAKNTLDSLHNSNSEATYS